MNKLLHIFSKKSNKPVPEFWKEYLTFFTEKQDGKTPLEKIRFVAFDTETTGLNPQKDRILSFGAVSLSGNKMDLSNSLESYVVQDSTKKEAVLIHGILQNGKESKKSEEEAVIEFVRYAKNAVLVGHNVSFDIAIVNAALKRLNAGPLKNKSLDTAKTAIRVDQHSPSTIIKSSDYNLDTLCKRYKISMSNRHTAAGDAFITAVLLMKMLPKLKKRGVNNFKDLLKRTPF
ncbi:MAG: 3'-5' exonuclease [Bacteroidetes bacterium]|nr:MAG: 3'-5' exonuclease [Bacteroidota bacterium]